MQIDHSRVLLDFDDVLIRPKRSILESRKEVDLNRAFTFLHSKQTFNGIPIIATNMTTVGTIECAMELQKHFMFTWLHKFIQFENIPNDLLCNHYAITIGQNENLLMDLVNNDKKFKYIRIDVANGYRESFVKFITKTREYFPETVIMAGNVCTAEMTEQLILAGADVVVVGIGPGGQCTTRVKSGVGYPQLSAIIECADAAHGLSGHIVSDGGCRTPGDVAKAFAAGADFVALGSMLAGHAENTAREDKIVSTINYGKPGYPDDIKYKVRTYGMSSEHAMNKFYGGVEDHRTSEGKVSWIDYKGPIENTIKDILGGVRSACTYVGARKLKELSKRTTFVLVNRTHNTFYDGNSNV